MIDTNSSTARRSAFGKLDSMARKVTSGFQEDSLKELKGVDEVPHSNPDLGAHGLMAQKPGMTKKFSSNLVGQ